MRYCVWYGESRVGGRYVSELAGLVNRKSGLRQIWGTARREFVKNPRAVQQILYLDRPDVIVTEGEPERPVLAVEFCAEAPSGHNICQRLARVVAAAEFGTPFAFVFPKRKWIVRQSASGPRGRWDEYNPLPLRVMLQIARFHRVPVMAFFWEANEAVGREQDGFLLYDEKYPGLPRRSSTEVRALEAFLRLAIDAAGEKRPPSELALHPACMERETAMQAAYWERTVAHGERWSPLTDTTEISTRSLQAYVRKHTGLKVTLAEHMRGRPRAAVYAPEVKTFRADPYAGNLVAVDYHECRNGPTTAHRHKNLILHLPQVPFSMAMLKFERYHERHCPMRSGGYGRADRHLALHLRDGCRYTKQKELRAFCYLADMVIFEDAVLY